MSNDDHGYQYTINPDGGYKKSDRPLSEERVQQLRDEGALLVEKGKLAFRSCWLCNSSHAHLIEWTAGVINCFACGRWFFKGVDITIPAEEEEDDQSVSLP